MTSEDLIKKLQDEAKRHPHGWPPRTEKEEAQFIAGGQFGYGLAQEEIERLKGLIEAVYKTGQESIIDATGLVLTDYLSSEIDQSWQQFKEQNKL